MAQRMSAQDVLELERQCQEGYKKARREKAYSRGVSSLSEPPTVSYTFLWGLHRCLPWRHCWPKKRKGVEETRDELNRLLLQDNKLVWDRWEAEADAVQTQVAMVSGKTWELRIGRAATGAEAKRRAAELAGLRTCEVVLICGGAVVSDSELICETHRERLSGHAPQLQLVRVGCQQVLSASTDSTLRLWDIDKGDCLRVMTGHGDGVSSFGVDWTSRCALTGSHDCTLRLWDLDHGVCVQSLGRSGHPAFCVALDYGARRALTGSWDSQLNLWDLQSGRCIRTLEGHSSLVSCVALGWPQRRAVSGSYDATLRVWDLEPASGEAVVCIGELTGHTHKVYAVEVDWIWQRALSSSEDTTVRLWDMSRLEDAAHPTCVATLRGHESAVSCLSAAWHEDRALSGSWDQTIRVWDLASLECLLKLEAHQAPITTCSLDWHRSMAVTGASDCRVRVWDLSSGSCIHTCSGHKDAITRVAASGEQQRMDR